MLSRYENGLQLAIRILPLMAIFEKNPLAASNLLGRKIGGLARLLTFVERPEPPEKLLRLHLQQRLGR
jgi:hypothetical protein